MKHSKNAIKFLIAEYRAIFKRAYVKGITTSLAFAALTASAGVAQAQEVSLNPSSNNSLVISTYSDIAAREATKDEETGDYTISGETTISEAIEDANNIVINSGSATTVTANVTASGSITADSALTVTGDGATVTITASGDIALNNGATITSGSLVSSESVTISSGTTLDDASSIQAAKDITLNGNVSNAGSLTATGSVIVNGGAFANGGDITANALVVSGASVTLSGGSVDIEENLDLSNVSSIGISGDAAVAVDTGTLSVAGSGTTFNVGASGTVTASGDFTVNDSNFTLAASSGGTFSVEGNTVISGSASLTASGDGSALNFAGAEITDGDLTLQALESGSITFDNAVNITNGSLDITASESGAVSISGAAITSGSLTVNATDSGNVTFSNAIDITDGGLSLTASGADAAISGTAINLTSGSEFSLSAKSSGTITLSGDINYEGAGASLEAAGGTISGANIAITGDNFALSATEGGSIASEGNIDLAGNSGSITLSGDDAASSISGSAISITGSNNQITIGASGAISAGSTDSGDDSFRALTAGNFSLSGSSNIITIEEGGSLSAAGEVSIEGSDSSVTVASGATFSGASLSLVGASLEFASGASGGISEGVKVGTGGSLTLGADIGATSISVAGGELKFAEVDSLDLASLTSLDVKSGSFVNNAAASLSAAETVALSNATLTNTGSLEVSGDFTASNTNIDNQAALTVSGDFTASNSEISLKGSGTLTVGGLSVKGGSLTAGADIDAGEGSVEISNATVALNAASISASGATFNNANTTVSGESSIGAPTTISGGTFTVSADSSVTFGTAGGDSYSARAASGDLVVSAGTFNNSGSVTVNNAASIDGVFNNSGTVNVTSGDFTVSGNYTNAAESTTTVTAGALTISGSFVNNGTLTLNSSGATVNGSFDNAGGKVNLGSGTISFTKDVTLNGTYASGTVSIASGTTVTVSGSDLNGTLLGSGGVLALADVSTKLNILGDADFTGIMTESGSLVADGKLSGSGIINVEGTATLNAAYNLESGSFTANSLTTSGAFELKSGELKFKQNFENGEAIKISSGTLTYAGTSGDGAIGSLTVSGGDFVVESGKLVFNSGTAFNVESGNVKIGENKTAFLDASSASVSGAASDGTYLAVKSGSTVSIGKLGSLAIDASDALTYAEPAEVVRAKEWGASDFSSMISGAAGSVLYLKNLEAVKDDGALSTDDIKAVIALFSGKGVKVDIGDVAIEGLIPGQDVSYGLGYDSTLGSSSTIYKDNTVTVASGQVNEDIYWGASCVGAGQTGLSSANNITLVNTEYNDGFFVKTADGQAGDITQTDATKIVDLRGSGEVANITTSGSVILANKTDSTGASLGTANIKTQDINAESGATISGVNADIASLTSASGSITISDTEGSIGAVSASGAVAFDNVSATFTSNVESTSGSFTLENSDATFQGAVTASGAVTITNSASQFAGSVTSSAGDVIITDSSAQFTGDIASTAGSVTITNGAGTYANVSAAENVSVTGASGATFKNVSTSGASKNLSLSTLSNVTFEGLTNESGAVVVSNVAESNLGDVTAKTVAISDSAFSAGVVTLGDSGSTLTGGSFNIDTIDGSSVETTDSSVLAISKDASGTIGTMEVGSGDLSVAGSQIGGKDFVNITNLNGSGKLTVTSAAVFVDSLNSDMALDLKEGAFVAINNIAASSAPVTYAVSPRASADALVIGKEINVPENAGLALGFDSSESAAAKESALKLLNGSISGTDLSNESAEAPVSRQLTTIKASSVLAINKPVEVTSSGSITVGGSSASSGAIVLADNAVLAITKQAYAAASESNPLITGNNETAVIQASGDGARIALDDLGISIADLEKVISNGSETGKAIGDNITVTDASGLFNLSSGNTGGGGNGGAVIPPYDGPDSDEGGADNNTKPVDPFADFLRMRTSRGMYEYIMDIYYGGNLTELAKSAGGSYITTQVSNGKAPENVEATARLSAAAGTAQSAVVAQNAFVNAIYERNGIGGSASTLAANGMGGAMWLTPTYTNFSSSSFSAERANYGTDISLSSLTLGADYTINNAVRVGGAFNIGTGSTDGKGFASSVSSDLSYYGFSVYGAYNFNALTVLGDITYSVLGNDVTQNAYEAQLTSDNDAKALSLGVTAKYEIDLGNGYSVAPHAGLRYTSLDIDNFDAKLNNETIAHGDVSKQSIVSIPVGVSFAADIAKDAWSLRPNVDLTLTANTGDLDQDVTTTFNGLDSINLSTDTFDSFTYGIKAGLDAASGNLKLGVKVGYTGSSNTNEFGVNGTVSYAF